MLKKWVKILPFFVVEKLAKSGERFEINIRIDGDKKGLRSIVRPFKGVYIEANEQET